MEREENPDSKHTGTPFTIYVSSGQILHFIKPNCVIHTLGITIILALIGLSELLMNRKDKGPANSR